MSEKISLDSSEIIYYLCARFIFITRTQKINQNILCVD